MFKSYWNAVRGAASAPPKVIADFCSMPTACSKGSRLMFCTNVKWNGTSGSGLRHGGVHLPVLVTHRGRCGAGLVDAIEGGLHDGGIFSGFDLLLQRVALGATGEFHEGRD